MAVEHRAPLVLIAGLPAVFAAVEAAGYRVQPGTGGSATKALAAAGRAAAQRNEPYVVLAGAPDRQTRIWLSLIASQGVPVVVLSGSSADIVLPGAVRVVDLPASVDDVVSAAGLEPRGGPIGDSLIGIDLAVSFDGANKPVTIPQPLVPGLVPSMPKAQGFAQPALPVEPSPVAPVTPAVRPVSPVQPEPATALPVAPVVPSGLAPGSRIKDIDPGPLDDELDFAEQIGDTHSTALADVDFDADDLPDERYQVLPPDAEFDDFGFEVIDDAGAHPVPVSVPITVLTAVPADELWDGLDEGPPIPAPVCPPVPQSAEPPETPTLVPPQRTRVSTPVLARPVAHAASLSPLLTTFASKGGVGKSSYALFLAERASLGGLNVALIDANRGQADLGKYLRLDAAHLPTVLDAAYAGDPLHAISPPDAVNAARGPRMTPLHFYLVVGAADELADPNVVTVGVLRQVIELCRAKCDLTIVDTQIVEAYDLSGVFDQALIPAMAAEGGYGVGISDASRPGLDNIEHRLLQFVGYGIPPNRLFSLVNRSIPQFEAEYTAQVSERLGRSSQYLGHVPGDDSVIHAMNQGEVPHAEPAIAQVVDEILYRVTGLPQFDPSHHVAAGKRSLLARLIGGRR